MVIFEAFDDAMCASLEQSIILMYEHDEEAEPYWKTKRFWPNFIRNLHYDHAYLVDIFKVVLGDCNYRTLILQEFLPSNVKFQRNYYDSNVTLQQRLEEIRLTWLMARRRRETVFITWEYPAVVDQHGDHETHFAMFVACPRSMKILSIDSRGSEYIKNFSDLWHENLKSIKRIFRCCEWIEVIDYDMQANNVNDSFCQIWSLLVALNVFPTFQKNKSSDDRSLHFHTIGYSYLVDFLRSVIRISSVKEAIYHEIYSLTHRVDGTATYHRYFSTLETLVTGGIHEYYPKDLTYAQTGFTFLEDFLEELDCTLLNNILK